MRGSQLSILLANLFLIAGFLIGNMIGGLFLFIIATLHLFVSLIAFRNEQRIDILKARKERLLIEIEHNKHLESQLILQDIAKYLIKDGERKNRRRKK